MERQSVKVIEGGKIVLPARFRRALGIEPGDTVTIELDEHELRLKTLDGWIRKVQAMTAHVRPVDGRSLVDEFIAEKREDAAREMARDDAQTEAWKRGRDPGA